MELDSILQAYARIAPLDDLLFGRTMNRGRMHAVLATNGRAGRVLEVGVGKGFRTWGHLDCSRWYALASEGLQPRFLLG